MFPSDHINHSLNSSHPLKIVLLGGPNVGKSTFANRLQSHYFRETYYPTQKPTKLLIDFQVQNLKSKAILDEYGGLQAKSEINGKSVLSPTIFQSFNKYNDSSIETIKKGSKKVMLKNNLYGYHYNDSHCSIRHYHAPNITPISVEIIDTPAFRKDMIVPFLEVSLFRNLDKEDLYGLADEPRRPVSTNPLLVASGAGELDGRVDGYLFMYSAIPSSSTSNPPSYDDAITPVSSARDDEPILKRRNSFDETDSLTILETIRIALYDAWQEFRSYQRKWKKGAEGDIYSLVYGLKQLWRMKNYEDEQRKLQELRQYSNKLDSLNWDPSDPDAPPPIVIVCSHSNHPGASPLLIEAGRRLAGLWCCGFVQFDSETNEGTEEVLAMMIRECVERRKLQTQKVSNSKR